MRKNAAIRRGRRIAYICALAAARDIYKAISSGATRRAPYFTALADYASLLLGAMITIGQPFNASEIFLAARMLHITLAFLGRHVRPLISTFRFLSAQQRYAAEDSRACLYAVRDFRSSFIFRGASCTGQV